MVVNMAEKTIGSLEEQALKRKERLNSLKRKRQDNGEESAKVAMQEITLPKPKFRSYKPEDEQFHDSVLPAALPGDVQAEIMNQLKAAQDKVVINELDITNLAPRKPDWDLKRDAARKIEKLEKRTHRAIAELIRERLKQKETDLADAVKSADKLYIHK